jgi:hypothetical protein
LPGIKCAPRCKVRIVGTLKGLSEKSLRLFLVRPITNHPDTDGLRGTSGSSARRFQHVHRAVHSEWKQADDWPGARLHARRMPDSGPTRARSLRYWAQ